jgi:prevent-host-death family protein
MRGFTATELANNTGDVLMAAAGEPIEITRHGKPQFVLMTQALYTQLLTQNGMEPQSPATPEAVIPATGAPKVAQAKPAVKTARKAKRKKKKAKTPPESNATAALELMQALQSWSDD